MASIIWSICAIGAVIGIGWLARRFDRVGQEAATALAQVTYWVASVSYTHLTLPTTPYV